ncbi:unnamed protein product [Fusarium graminearum]|nr:unnamed protein product [Fusarium graminearum]
MHVFAHPKNRGRVLVLRAYLLMYHLSTNPELLAQTGGAAGAPVYDHDSIANWPIISQNLPCSPMRTGRLSNVSTKMGEPGQTTGTVLAATAIETNDLQVVVIWRSEPLGVSDLSTHMTRVSCSNREHRSGQTLTSHISKDTRLDDRACHKWCRNDIRDIKKKSKTSRLNEHIWSIITVTFLIIAGCLFLNNRSNHHAP